VFIKTWSQLRPTYDLASLAGREWVTGWLNSLILTQKLSIILPLAVLLTLLGQKWGREGFSRKKPSRPFAGPVLSLASMCALAVWFTQAPAARFAAVYFWILLAAVIANTAQTGTRERPVSRRVPVAVGCAVLATYLIGMLLEYAQVDGAHQPGVFAVVAFGVLWAIPFHTAGHRPAVVFVLIVLLGFSQIGERVFAHTVRGRWDEIAPMVWYNVGALPRKPTFEHTARQTRSGLTLYVSSSSSFSTPIPNTRYFNPYLELRRPGDLRSGFRNAASSALGYGYAVDYVIQPNAGREIVVPAGE
jgi:hypothetical protein